MASSDEIVVLKKKHNIANNKAALMALMKVERQSTVPPGNPARLESGKPLAKLKVPVLSEAFSVLVGESPDDILDLLARERNHDNYILLVHSAIIVANRMGAPASDVVYVNFSDVIFFVIFSGFLLQSWWFALCSWVIE